MNAWDSDTRTINGLNISGLSEAGRVNGVALGLVGCTTGEEKPQIINGVAMGGVLCKCHNINGIGLSGLCVSGDTLNGLFGSFGFPGIVGSIGRVNGVMLSFCNFYQIYSFNGFCMGPGLEGELLRGFFLGLGNKVKISQGVSVCWFGNFHDRQRGLAISCINISEELHGVQIGLINYAGNNRKLLRILPIINFHLRK